MRSVVLFSIWLLAAQAQTPPAPVALVPDSRPPVASNCSADGVVVNSITGEVVPRARVSLLSAGTLTTVLSDSGGRFRMEKTSCGFLQFLARHVGFLEALSPQPKALNLESGEAAHDVRVMLTPQAVVTGVVSDDQGDPVQGAQVAVYGSKVLQGKRAFQQMGQGMSNDLGEYRVSGLAGGKYVVCAHLNQGVPPMEVTSGATTGDKCFPGPLDGGVVSTFELQAGRDIRINLPLPSIPSVHVRGVVTGLPKARGVALALSRRGAVGNAWNRSTPVRPDGRFDIAGVTPGSYLLSTDYWEDNRRYTARIPLEVGGGDIDGITVQLTEGFTIQGVVRVESKDGVVPPRNQFTVSLRSSEPIAGGGRMVWGADGTTFTLSDLTPGSYRLESFSNSAFFIKRATFNGRDISREDVAITQPSGVVELVLSDEGGTVEVQLEDRDGKPAVGWAMLVEEGRTPRTSRSDAKGHVRFPSIAPGNYMIYAWDDMAQVEFANPEWMRRNAEGQKLAVEAGQTARVKLVQKQVAAQ